VVEELEYELVATVARQRVWYPQQVWGPLVALRNHLVVEVERILPKCL
jgi:hypothetical protein